MAGYGLLDPTTGILTPATGRRLLHSYHCYFFAWQSILNEDELAEVERRNKIRDGGHLISLVQHDLTRDYTV